ncbi:MAG: TolC family protein [Candidatus Delongbacteria bacterium]|nr:TolC family protein [Candidatus Delongbacteria bacterium]
MKTCNLLLLIAGLVGLVCPVGAVELDLAGFLKLVDRYSHDMKLAAQDLETAAANKKEAWATALPKIGAEAGYNRNLTDNFMFIGMEDHETGEMATQKLKFNFKNEYSFSAAISQTLFSFKVGNALKAASQYSRMSEYLYSHQVRAVRTQARKAFYQTLLLQKVYGIAQASEINAQENFQQMERKFQVGVVSEFQLLQAEVRWKNLTPETGKALRNYQLALNSLKTMCGIPVDSSLQISGDFELIPPLPEKNGIATIIEQRPDYNAMIWEKKLRETGVKAQVSDYLPSLEGKFIFNYSSQTDEWDPANENRSYIAGLTLTIPIYTGGYTGAQVKKSRIDLEKSKIRLDQTRQWIETDLNNIHQRMEEALARIESARTVMVTAEKAYMIAQTSADNGLATQLELKDSRIYCDQAKVNYYAAIYDYLDACFDWELGTGQ